MLTICPCVSARVKTLGLYGMSFILIVIGDPVTGSP